MMSSFFSNKYNLIGLHSICTFIITYVLFYAGYSVIQILLLYGIMILMNFATYIYGMSKGMIHMYTRSEVYKDLIDRAEHLKETEKDGK